MKKKIKHILIIIALLISNIVDASTPIIGNANPLPGSTETYYVNLMGGTSGGVTCALAWTITNGVITSPCNVGGTICATVLTPGVAAITVKWNCSPGTGFSVAAEDRFCNSGSYSNTLYGTIQNAAPVAGVITGTDTVCLGETMGYSSTFGANTSSYNWQIQPSSAGVIQSGQGTQNITIQWLEDGDHDVEVTPINPYGCTGTQKTFDVNVKDPTPLNFTQATATVCGGLTSVIYTVAPTSADPDILSYSWSLPIGVNIATGAGTASISVDFDPYAQSGDIIATSNYACGPGASISTPVTVNVLPYPPSAIQGAVAVCNQASTANTSIYSINAVTNATDYDWQISGGTILSSSPYSNTITVQWNSVGTGTLSVRSHNTCGYSPATSTLNVTVHPSTAVAIVDTDTLDHTALTALSSSDLVFNHCASSDACSNKTIDKAKLFLLFNTGEDYNYGSNAFTTSVEVEITGYGGIGGTGPVVINKTVTLAINEAAPEQLYHLDFSADYYQIHSFDIEIISYTGHATVEDDIQLVAYYEEDFKFNAQSSSPLVTNLVNTNLQPTSNQYQFTWSNSCAAFPNYEIQLLRLYNNDPADTTAQTTISADVDWKEALSIETYSSDTTIKLTLAEGTGYYVWRVRPIGNYYPGGIANDKNRGLWSDHGSYTQGDTGLAVSSGGSSYIFFYNQFNDTINWIYSRTFTEGNNYKNEQVRISENMTFANGLQQARQTQAHLSTTNKILTTQTVMDFSGRPALSTIPVPLDDEISLGFKPNFLKNLSSLIYTAEDFDADTTYQNPGGVTDGPSEHFAYYSDNNADLTIPGAEQYPFTRTLFYNDGNSRVKEQSGVGATFKITANLNDSRTTKTFYSGVADEELIRVFGDEAPIASSVHKVINVDGNNTASVTYIGKDGKTLATCLAINGSNTIGDNTAPLMGLASQNVASLSVSDTINNTTPYGDYGNQATTSQTFMEETTVNIHYDLTPKAVQDLCLEYCATCDYYIEISIQEINQPDSAWFYHEMLLPSGICDSANLAAYEMDTTVTLSPGTYIFTKRVVANNTDTATITTTDSIGSTYFEIHQDSLRIAYDSLIYGASGQLAVINGYLDSADIEGLYTYLGININQPISIFEDSVVYIPIGCDSIAIPIILCEPKICPPDTSFAAYFDNYWGDISLPANYTFSSISGGYSNAEFDTLVSNMISDGYSCDSLWDCWYSIVQNYELLNDSLYGNPNLPAGITFNIVDAFLDCAGRRIEGIEPPATYDKTLAYKIFSYTLGSDTICENYFVDQYAPTSCTTPFGSCFVDSTWTEFYMCVTHTDPNPSNPIADTNAYSAAQAITDTCRTYCEKQKTGYIDAIINAFHQDQQYVAANPDTSSTSDYLFSGDIYTLEYDSTFSQYFFNDTIPLDSQYTTYVPWTEIECMAEALVNYCKQGCTITPVFDSVSGNLISMGTEEEIAAYQNSFMSAYEVALPQPDGQGKEECGEGWETIAGNKGGTSCIWGNFYGGSNHDKSNDFGETNNGNFLLVGLTYSNDGHVHNAYGNGDGWVVKIDENGDTLWTKVYGGTGYDEITSFVQTPQGDFYMVGHTTSTDGDLNNNNGLEDYWIIKTDASGNVIWSKNYGNSNSEKLNGITLGHSGGVVVVGTYNTYYSQIKKIDDNGNILWNKSMDFTIYSVIKGDAGNYVAVGHDFNGDQWIYKFDDNGNTVWAKTYGGTGADIATSIIYYPADSGQYFVSGRSNSTNGDFISVGDYDYTGLMLTEQGNKIWSKTYGGSASDLSNRTNFVGTTKFTISGASNSNDGDVHGNVAHYDAWVLEADMNGDTVWTKTIGSNYPDYAVKTIRTSDGCYLVGGYSGDHSKYFVLKYCPDGCYECRDFCFRYVPWPQIPDSIPVILPLTCAEVTANDLKNSINHQVYEYIEEKIDSFATAYRNTCVNPDSINDNFVLNYPLGYHHYTLYYYNRAGTLIQTVPPQGVDLLDINNPNDPIDEYTMNRNTAPKHRFITDYEYNSLGQLIKQDTPDGDTTEFYYNNLGQLRFSQNAQQQVDSTYSYTKYDALGRILEVGQSTQAISNNNFTLDANIANTLFPNDIAKNSQVTYTVYTESAGVSYLNDGVTTQRYLQNRVSYSYTDADGDPITTDDQTYTYYSYDPHGNVEWLVQDIPGFLDKQYLRYEYDLVSGNVLKVCYNEGRTDQFYHRYAYDADNRIIKAETSVNDITWEKDAQYDYYIHGPLARTALGEDKIQGLDYIYTIQGWLKALNHASLDKSLDPGNDGTNGTSNFAKDVFAMQLGYFTGDFNRTNSPYNTNTGGTVHATTLNPDANRSLYNGNISTWASNNIQYQSGTDPYPGLTGYQYRYDELNRIRIADFKQNVNLSGFSGALAAYSSTYDYDANGNFYNLTRNGNAIDGIYMDSLKYYYYDISGSAIYDESSTVPTLPSNKLAYVTDTDTTISYADDLESQASGNYTYDKIGNLISDAEEEIQEIKWTVYGKISEIIRTSLSTKPNLKFIYDASGNRIAKIVIPEVNDPVENTITWYSRDASGNIMAIYESTYESTTGGMNEFVHLIEQPMYGSSRLGTRTEKKLIKTIYHPTGGSPLETSNLPANRSAENTHLSIGTQRPLTVTYYPGPGNFNIGVITPEAGGKMDVDFTNLPPAVSAANATFNFGVQGNNVCVVEDGNNNVAFRAFTAKQIGFNNSVCRVLDANNNLMPILNLNNPIKANWKGKSMGMKKPGTTDEYYLFTVGTDKKPYYHVINTTTGTVTSNNILLDTVGTNYGYGMALIIDDTPVANSTLYLRRYNSTNGTAEIVTIAITTGGIGTPMVPVSFSSYDANGTGEIQISPDGTKLAIANHKSSYGWWNTQGEIRTYHLNPAHEIVSLYNTFSTGNLSMLQSFDFSPSSEFVFYERQSTLLVFPPVGSNNGKSIKRLNIHTQHDTLVAAGKNGEVRRAKNQKLYVVNNNLSTAMVIHTPDAAFTTTTPTILAAPWKTTRGMSLNPHRISIFDDSYITREMHLKNYEISDHLGNVRAVVSDLKLSTLNVSTGVPEDFEPELKVINNLYAFGSNQPNRSFFDADGSGTFGFNGMLKDNEIKGESNSYDFGARIYDPRIGKWLSVDPLWRNYESYTSYGFALNNPIKNIDVGGSIVVDKDGNPVYTTLPGHQEVDKKTGITKYYERRVYYSNAGNEIHVNALIKKTDANGVDMDITAKEMYICHGYTQLASREDYLNPDASNHKVLLTAEYTEKNEEGKVLKVHENMKNLLTDDYLKLDVNMKGALDIARENKGKVIAVWYKSNGLVGHSALVDPNAEYDDLPYVAKFGTTEFDGGPTGNKANSEYNNEVYTFGGYYQYTGDKEIDISTVKGKTNKSSDEVKAKIK